MALHGLPPPAHYTQRQSQTHAQRMPVAHQGVSVHSAASTSVHSPVMAPGNIAPRSPSVISTENAAVQRQPKAIRPFPQLKAFMSIAQLYQIAMHGDEMSGILSLLTGKRLIPIGCQVHFHLGSATTNLLEAFKQLIETQELLAWLPLLLLLRWMLTD